MCDDRIWLLSVYVLEFHTGFIWKKVVVFKRFDNNLTMSFYLCGDSSSIPCLQGSKSEITKGDGRNYISTNGR